MLRTSTTSTSPHRRRLQTSMRIARSTYTLAVTGMAVPSGILGLIRESIWLHHNPRWRWSASFAISSWQSSNQPLIYQQHAISTTFSTTFSCCMITVAHTNVVPQRPRKSQWGRNNSLRTDLHSTTTMSHYIRWDNKAQCSCRAPQSTPQWIPANKKTVSILPNVMPHWALMIARQQRLTTLT